MSKINLLRSLPKSNRDIKKRKEKKNTSVINESRKFGKKYFDGDRKFGYGGYYDDGRWALVAKDIINYYKLKKNSKVLDVGCAKGFLVKEFRKKDIEAYGIDISTYALRHADESIKKNLFKSNVLKIPFIDNYFDLVISINTIHNLDEKNCIKAIKEILRVGKNKYFLQVDSYYNERQKKIFEDWVLTAKTYGYPNYWKKIFKSANYDFDYYWTIMN